MPLPCVAFSLTAIEREVIGCPFPILNPATPALVKKAKNTKKDKKAKNAKSAKSAKNRAILDVTTKGKMVPGGNFLSEVPIGRCRAKR